MGSRGYPRPRRAKIAKKTIKNTFYMKFRVGRVPPPRLDFSYPSPVLRAFFPISVDPNIFILMRQYIHLHQGRKLLLGIYTPLSFFCFFGCIVFFLFLNILWVWILFFLCLIKLLFHFFIYRFTLQMNAIDFFLNNECNIRTCHLFSSDNRFFKEFAIKNKVAWS